MTRVAPIDSIQRRIDYQRGYADGRAERRAG
jgi:hypothetical protein